MPRCVRANSPVRTCAVAPRTVAAFRFPDDETLPDSAYNLLQERFGFASFRAGQEAVIGQLLAGNSALAVFPTGSGKSLCYQLPALLLPGLTVVVSPLIALMKDQVDFLQARGIRAERLDSSVSREAFEAIQSALATGQLKLLYVAPERFSNERFLARLKSLTIDLLVIDEAHCISEWGHNFRPDYLKLARYARELNVGRVLALTATATPTVAKDICRSLPSNRKPMSTRASIGRTFSCERWPVPRISGWSNSTRRSAPVHRGRPSSM